METLQPAEQRLKKALEDTRQAYEDFLKDKKKAQDTDEFEVAYRAAEKERLERERRRQLTARQDKDSAQQARAIAEKRKELEELEKQCRHLESRISEQSTMTSKRHHFAFTNTTTREDLEKRHTDLWNRADRLTTKIIQSRLHHVTSASSLQEKILGFLRDIFKKTVEACQIKMKEGEDNLHQIIMKTTGLQLTGGAQELSVEDRSRLRDILRHEAKDKLPTKFHADKLAVNSAICKSVSNARFFDECKRRCNNCMEIQWSAFDEDFNNFAQTCAEFAWTLLTYPTHGELLAEQSPQQTDLFKHYSPDVSSRKYRATLTVVWPALLDSEKFCISQGVVYEQNLKT